MWHTSGEVAREKRWWIQERQEGARVRACRRAVMRVSVLAFAYVYACACVYVHLILRERRFVCRRVLFALFVHAFSVYVFRLSMFVFWARVRRR